MAVAVAGEEVGGPRCRPGAGKVVLKLDSVTLREVAGRSDGECEERRSYSFHVNT